MASFEQRRPATRDLSSADALNADPATVEVVGATPDCGVATIGPCIVLLWRQAVVMQGPELVRKAIFKLGQSKARDKIAFLTVAEPNCELTTPPEVRQKLADLLNQHQAQLAAAAITFEGRGFRMTLVRSIITAINMASRGRFPNAVFSDVTTAADWLERRGALGVEMRAEHVIKTVNMLRVL